MSSRAALIRGLKEYNSFIIVAHENPDPDSIGSVLALYHGLRQLGKQCEALTLSAIPVREAWPGAEIFRLVSPEVDLDLAGFQAVVILDCTPDRTGLAKIIDDYPQMVTFNIDHHLGNRGLCDYNYIDSGCAATAILVHDSLRDLGVQITPVIAQNIYTGIVGDTGGFRYANTSAELLRLAGELVDIGARPAETARQIFLSKPWPYVKLLGRALENIDRTADHRVVWMTVSYDDFRETGADPGESDQLVQYAQMVEGADVAVLFREVSPEKVRISLRSHTIDVRAIAEHYGGGGHRLAAGAKAEGPLFHVVHEVIKYVRSML